MAQQFQDTILGSKPVLNENEENPLKSNFDEIVSRINSLSYGQDSNRSYLKKKEKLSDDSYKVINSLSNSIESADQQIKEQVQNLASKQEISKDPYLGEMHNNLRNGFGIYVYENKFFRYEIDTQNKGIFTTGSS